jgi:hypothetical protein
MKSLKFLTRAAGALLALALLASQTHAANDKPLVTIGGQTRQLPSTDGLQLNAGSTGAPSLNLACAGGAAPTSPADGDFWCTTAGLFIRAGGVTIGPFASSVGGLAAIGANTVVGNFTGSSAAPASSALTDCHSANQFVTYTAAGGASAWGCGTATGGGGGGVGTITSVALSLPGMQCTVSGSPVTTSGTLTCTANTQTANTIYAGPASGAAAQPGFRPLVTADLPTTVPAIDILSPDKPKGTKGSAFLKASVLTHGSTVDLLPTVSCAGYVDHIWIANGAYDLEVIVTVDGEVTPSIDQRLPNLLGAYYNGINSLQPAFTSKWISTASGGTNQQGGMFNLPIPFASSVHIQIKNNHATNSYTIWGLVTYQCGVPDNWPYTQRLFAVQAENDTMSANSTLSMLNITPGKKGRLAGFAWLEDSTAGSASPATAPLEGAFKITLDGTLAITSSGGEDFFGMGGYFVQQTAPVIAGDIGLTMANASNKWSAFRFFVQDPIVWQGTGAETMTWACGNTTFVSFTGTCKSQTTVYYYLEN